MLQWTGFEVCKILSRCICFWAFGVLIFKEHGDRKVVDHHPAENQLTIAGRVLNGSKRCVGRKKGSEDPCSFFLKKPLFPAGSHFGACWLRRSHISHQFL